MLIAPTIVTLAIVIGYPVIRAVWMSFHSDAALDPATGFFVEGGWAGFENYTHWLLQRCGDTRAPSAARRAASGRSSGSRSSSRS